MIQPQLMSWTKNLSFDNKWDRISFSKQGAFVIAWVWYDEDKFHANVRNVYTHEGDSMLVTKTGMESLDEAKAFADAELKKQGYKV